MCFGHAINIGEQLLVAVRCINGFNCLAWRQPAASEIVEATCEAVILLIRLLVRAYYVDSLEAGKKISSYNHFCLHILINTFSYWLEGLVATVFWQMNDSYTPQSAGRARLNFTILSILKL